MFALAAYSRACQPHYDLRGDSLGVWGKWQRGLLNLINWGSILGEDTSELPIFVEFRCILFGDTSESDIFVESRCIRNVWFLEHTSEMPNLGAFPMYYDQLPKQNTSEFQGFTQSRCIHINFPRFYPFSLSVNPRASRLQFHFPRKQASL